MGHFVIQGSKSTLAVAVEKMTKKCPPEDLFFWWGGGILACCYGFSDESFLQKLKEKFPIILDDELLVRSGPRQGQKAVSLFNIISYEAKRLGLQGLHTNITKESCLCTSCSGEHWSHVRGDKEGNAAIAVIL